MQTDPALSINDESVSIFTRFQVARRYRGSIKWWTSQLNSSDSFDEKFRVLQGAFIICGPRTLGKLLSTAEGFLDSLSEESFSRLVQGINRIRFRAHSKSEIASLGLSDRALIMYVRACGFTEGDVSTLVRHVEDYTGNDPAILNFFLEITPTVHAGMDSLQDVTWTHFLDLTRRAYLQDVTVDDFVIRRLTRTIRSMPIETAREASGNRNSYPCSVIDLTERRCLQFFASQQRPLLEIANESWWPADA
jgi:hypothetical protein